MKDFPIDPMRQHDLFVTELCRDWLESGIVSLNTEHTPRANRVAEISRQLREAGTAQEAPASNHD